MRLRSRFPLFVPSLLSLSLLILPAAPVTAVPAAPAPLPAAARAKLDAPLRAALPGLAPGARLPVIVMLQERADLERLEAEIVAAGLGRRARAGRVIAALHEVAVRSQPPLRAALEARAARGEVRNLHAMWLINAFTLSASRAVVEETAARGDVERVYLDGRLELEQPEAEAPATAQPGAAEIGLRAVNAPALWALGYTGAGTIVMNIDTGVQGTHAALVDRWVGNRPGVPVEQAWFDAGASCPAPCDYGTHGTHTMGIMTGLDPATQDTTGVAFGAEWIAAATLVGAPSHTSFSLAAFEWAIDGGSPFSARPPASVISNSWWDPSVTQQGDCGPNGTYWEVIDNFEAIGGAVVFSAGNSGPGAQTITRPKNRITTPVNIWATGNVDANQAGFPIRSSSSRGPSNCDGQTPKPEAVAPGTSVRAPVPGGYGFKTGTSMASPHVAGVIALLMEAFPWATGTEIKLALIATATDLGTPGEDNTYGNGLIDAGAAYAFLLGAAAVREAAAGPGAAGVRLGRSAPNPFNPSTSITYELPEASVVSLRVYNFRGQVVAAVVDAAPQGAGAHTAGWDGTMYDGRRAPSGMYAFRLETRPLAGGGPPVVRMRKAVLLK